MTDTISGFATTADGLKREFAFADFRQAFAFLTEVAQVAEELQHHPDIHVVYSKVTLTLRTHDAGNVITGQDIGLAKRLDAVYQNFTVG